MSRGLLRSAVTVGANTFASRLLGFVRDIVIAHVFGAGLGADAFFVAFRVPNFTRRLFVEGAFAQAFVPIFAEYRTRRSHEALRALTADLQGALGAASLLLSLVGVLAAPLLVLLLAPGYTYAPEKFALTVDLFRITFPYVAFIVLTALGSAMLNTHERFGVPAFTPVLLNLALIGAALGLAPYLHRPVLALAWGVLIGGFAQLLFQLPFLHRMHILVRPRWRRGQAEVKRILRPLTPAIFGISVTQVNLLVDTLIASFLVTGSVSWLYFSDRLMEFPLGVFGLALSTVILPQLARRHTEGSPRDFAQTLDWALRWALLIAVPAAVALMLLATPVLATLFEYGEFGSHDVVMTSRSLVAFAFGLPAFVLVKVLAPAFFARHDTRTPVRVGLVAMLVNVVLGVALVYPLAHAGLALATSVAACLDAAWLFAALHRRGIHQLQPGWPAFLLQVLGANLAMAAVLLYGRGSPGFWLDADLATRSWHLASLIVAAALAYALTLPLVGLRTRALVPAP